MWRKIFVFLMLLPAAYSISYEELMDSYDFSYDDGSIGIDGISYYGKDEILYDKFIVRINFSVNSGGNYSFIGSLGEAYSENDVIVKDINNEIELSFNPRFLDEGEYNLSLSIFMDDELIFDQPEMDNVYFNNTDFSKPEFEIIDIYHSIDENSLIVDIIIDSDIEKDSNVSVFLVSDDKIVSKNINITINNGINEITVPIDKERLKRKENITLFKLDINEYSFEEDHFIYGLVFESEYSSIIGINDEIKIDKDGDGISEGIVLGVGLDIKEIGDYCLDGIIYDDYREYLDDIERCDIFNIGNNSIGLLINGTIISSKKIDGPYIIRSLELKKDNITIDSVEDIYKTEEYSYDEFELPTLPDLVIDVNESIVKVKNNGEIAALNFYVEYYDDESLIGSKYVFLLNPGQDISFDTENISSAIVDFDNNVEESDEENNIYFRQDMIRINMNLSLGWNYVALNISLENNSVPVVLASINNNYSVVFVYDDAWRSYSPNKPDFLNSLNEIETKKGFYLYMLIEDILELEGTKI